MEKKLENLESLLSLSLSSCFGFLLGRLALFFLQQGFCLLFLSAFEEQSTARFFWLTRSILKKTETVFFKLAPHGYSSTSPLRDFLLRSWRRSPLSGVPRLCKLKAPIKNAIAALRLTLSFALSTIIFPAFVPAIKTHSPLRLRFYTFFWWIETPGLTIVFLDYIVHMHTKGYQYAENEETQTMPPT
jgi:hypothetical protein